MYVFTCFSFQYSYFIQWRNSVIIMRQNAPMVCMPLAWSKMPPLDNIFDINEYIMSVLSIGTDVLVLHNHTTIS